MTELSFSTKSGKVVLDEKKNVSRLQTLTRNLPQVHVVPEYMLTTTKLTSGYCNVQV